MEVVGGGVPSRTTASETGAGLASHEIVDRAICPLELRQALVESPDFPHVGVARDYLVLREIGRIRHEQYVARQSKAYASVVLEKDCLIEVSDFVAVNIYARDSLGITCAMRIGDIADRHNPQTNTLQKAASRLGISPRTALTCGRLARAPRHSGRHAVDLVRFVRWQTVRAGWRYCLMQTAEPLVSFFTRLEFRETGIWSDDPAAGRLQVLVLDTEMRPTRKGER